MVPKEMNVEMNTISSEMEHCGGLILRCFEKMSLKSIFGHYIERSLF